MGYVSLLGPDGRVLEKANYGADGYFSSGSEIANDGFTTDLEVIDARERLEAVINGHECSSGGPLGLGGWGGINELCLQPYKLGGPAREQTPDGYSMKLKFQMVEEYRERVGYIFYSLKETEPKEFEVNVRWENGKVHLYQGTPPAYVPPAPPPETPDLSAELAKAGNYLLAGMGQYLDEASEYSASMVESLSSFTDQALVYFDSLSNHMPGEMAKK